MVSQFGPDVIVIDSVRGDLLVDSGDLGRGQFHANLYFLVQITFVMLNSDIVEEITMIMKNRSKIQKL
jgi:hypothetical protein